VGSSISLGSHVRCPQMRSRPALGTIIEIGLPNGRSAYGRVYRDAALALYRETTDEPGRPPIGSRDFRFTVGVEDDVFTAPNVRAVGLDGFGAGEDGWPPATSISDPITGAYRIYERGKIRPSSASEAAILEPAAVWSIRHLLDRIMGVGRSTPRG
jgi:hypothetical protein